MYVLNLFIWVLISKAVAADSAIFINNINLSVVPGDAQSFIKSKGKYHVPSTS